MYQEFHAILLNFLHDAIVIPLYYYLSESGIEFLDACNSNKAAKWEEKRGRF